MHISERSDVDRDAAILPHISPISRPYLPHISPPAPRTIRAARAEEYTLTTTRTLALSLTLTLTVARTFTLTLTLTPIRSC